MKVRIGFGLGTRTTVGHPALYGHLVDVLEELRFDSLWLSERVSADAPDPLIGLAVAAGRTERLKFGTSVLIVPGRSPVLLAKEMATLDRLSNGRFLPAVGLGVADPREQQAFGVQRGDRAAMFDEAMPLIRRLWSGEPVTHHGPWYHLDEVTVRPTPAQDPIDVWLGGLAPSELRRVGRLGDGWLPSFCTAEEVGAGIEAIAGEAERHDRAIDPEHYGALIAYRHGPLPDVLAAFLARRRPDVDPAAIVPEGLSGLRRTIDAMLDAGASKFVVLPLAEPTTAAAWDEELGALRAEILPLQT